MKTQKEQINEATQAYIMPLNEPRDGMGAARFAVYLARPNGLQVLWPGDCRTCNLCKVSHNKTVEVVIH